MQVVNIAAYKFVSIPDPVLWLPVLKERCFNLGLKGTVILAEEGINLFLAGSRASIDAFLDYLRHDTVFENRFSNLEVKESLSARQPFKRMVVRKAKEIITMRHPMIKPELRRAPSVAPFKLKKWIEQGHDDEGREILLLDTRNRFEVDIGTFENALELEIDKFSEFPAAFEKNVPAEAKEKTIVSFCTGGIRCEKAVLYLEEQGLPHVYQLEGGILRYFEEVGGAYWQGECFVFDERMALKPSLESSNNEFVRKDDGNPQVKQAN
ncbi:MAG: sulfurtransferase [Candidatus Obscuribacterales bacterium]|nr:sulfurtransferase [Candidatus Obscuribacterales bacterium]